MSDSRKVVYVSGAPGARKTSLAVPMAVELGSALLTKDRIKETLHDALGATGRGALRLPALVTVDTAVPVDVPAVAATVRSCYDW